MTELDLLCEVAASFYQRGYAFGSTGNLSVMVGEDIWITPTGVSLRSLRPENLARIGADGVTRNGNKPSKEFPFHLSAYRAAGDRARAIVHLHSTYSVALSCLEILNSENPLPAITPYYLMRVAPLAVLPYFRPGSSDLAAAVQTAAGAHDCMLLRNHGLICLGATLNEAVDRTEELEETARLFFLLRREEVRLLTAGEQDEIRRVFRPDAKPSPEPRTARDSRG
jgi:ribulose-5-phosphate 4-epimerase/fuculose-1-phosphate aldolase